MNMHRAHHPLISAAALAFGLALLPVTAARAQALDAKVVSFQGEVKSNGAPVQLGQAVAGTTLLTGPESAVHLLMGDGSMLVLSAASEVKLPTAQARRLALSRGGLALSTGVGRDWQVDLGNRSVRTNGFLKLEDCATGCTLPKGLYGRIAQGEAVLEYQGGRSVLRNRSFRWVDASNRPEVLASQPSILSTSSSQSAALRSRTEVASLLKTGLEAFNAGNDAVAIQALDTVRRIAPGETLVPYYRGLIALRQEDNASALDWLQQYAREDPEGAAAREVPKTLTLLSSTQLQQEVVAAVAREREVVSTPPEPGSIAVQAFVNQGDANYRAMAKGLAAMIIADLSKVPGLKVLEREKVQLLVNEAKLGDSGLADKASAVRSGRLMRAEKVVVGNFEVQP
jgi:TolB-like protein